MIRYLLVCITIFACSRNTVVPTPPSDVAITTAAPNATSSVSPQQDKLVPIWWQVKGAQGTSYLLGSNHLVPGHWVPDAVWERISNSRVVIVESVDDMAQDDFGMLFLPPDQDLQTLLGERHWKLLRQNVTTVPSATLKRFHPMFAELTMEVEQSRFTGEDESMDDSIIRFSQRNGITIQELDIPGTELLQTVLPEFTAATLAFFLDAKQREVLNGKVIDYEQRFLDGDYQGTLPPEITKMKQHFPDLYAAMLTNRNQKWIDKLVPELQQGNAFVVVGVAHYPFEEGLIALLQQRGLELTRVSQ